MTPPDGRFSEPLVSVVARTGQRVGFYVPDVHGILVRHQVQVERAGLLSVLRARAGVPDRGAPHERGDPTSFWRYIDQQAEAIEPFRALFLDTNDPDREPFDVGEPGAALATIASHAPAVAAALAWASVHAAGSRRYRHLAGAAVAAVLDAEPDSELPQPRERCVVRLLSHLQDHARSLREAVGMDGPSPGYLYGEAATRDARGEPSRLPDLTADWPNAATAAESEAEALSLDPATGRLLWDEHLARYLAGLGERGAELAEELRAEADARAAKLRGAALDLEMAFPGWTPERGRVWRGWFRAEEPVPSCFPWLLMLASALWFPMKRRLAHVPGVRRDEIAGWQRTVIDPDADAVKIEDDGGQLVLTIPGARGTRPSPIAVVSPAALDVADDDADARDPAKVARSLLRQMQTAAMHWARDFIFRKVTEQAEERRAWRAGELPPGTPEPPAPGDIEIVGGLERWREITGARNQTEARRLLRAGQHFERRNGSREIGGLWTWELRGLRAANAGGLGNPSVLRLRISPALEAAILADSEIAYLPGLDLAPRTGAPRTAPDELWLFTRVFDDLAGRAREYARNGSWHLTSAWFRGLAADCHLRPATADRLWARYVGAPDERAEPGDTEGAPPVFVAVGRDRFDLSDAHAAIRAKLRAIGERGEAGYRGALARIERVERTTGSRPKRKR